MKILTYSDLHFEFGHDWELPYSLEGDIMVLAGDIISFKNYEPLTRLLKRWNKPVLYIAGNHEYYTRTSMIQGNKDFKLWLESNHPDVIFLQDEAKNINGVNFFGGTMWTNFMNGDLSAMEIARQQMNDFKLIRASNNKILKPADTIKFHDEFVEKLLKWFNEKIDGPRIVISHHAPVNNPKTKYSNHPLRPAFVSNDLLTIIEKYQPDLWIYGHTHECDDKKIGRTRIISNQLGYPKSANEFECVDFSQEGLPVYLDF